MVSISSLTTVFVDFGLVMEFVIWFLYLRLRQYL